MKTNVSIELTDNQRDQLANWLDNKTTRRTATRADIKQLCADTVAGIFDCLNQPQAPAVPRFDQSRLDIIAPEDNDRLLGKPRGYIVGWNKVKYNRTSRA